MKIILDEKDWKEFNQTISDILNTQITEDSTRKIFDELEKNHSHIFGEVFMWGWSDTEVREKLHQILTTSPASSP